MRLLQNMKQTSLPVDLIRNESTRTRDENVGMQTDSQEPKIHNPFYSVKSSLASSYIHMYIQAQDL